MKVKAINPLNLGGRPYSAGAILEVPNPLAEKWLAMKYIEKAETEKKSEAVKAEEKPAVRKKTAKRPASKK